VQARRVDRRNTCRNVAGAKQRRDEMGEFVATRGQRIFGWAATAIMGVAAIALFVFV